MVVDNVGSVHKKLTGPAMDNEKEMVREKRRGMDVLRERKGNPSASSVGGTGLEAENEVRIVLVGETECGKSQLVNRFNNHSFSQAYVKTGFDKIQTNKLGIKFIVWDTSGLPSYSVLRPLVYRECDVVMICYRAGQANQKIIKKWIKEVEEHCEVPIMLVACKADLTYDKAEDEIEVISKEVNDGARPDNFATCVTSACTGLNVDDAFRLAASLVRKNSRNSASNNCNGIRSGVSATGGVLATMCGVSRVAQKLKRPTSLQLGTSSTLVVGARGPGQPVQFRIANGSSSAQQAKQHPNHLRLGVSSLGITPGNAANRASAAIERQARLGLNCDYANNNRHAHGVLSPAGSEKTETVRRRQQRAEDGVCPPQRCASVIGYATQMTALATNSRLEGQRGKGGGGGAFSPCTSPFSPFSPQSRNLSNSCFINSWVSGRQVGDAENRPKSSMSAAQIKPSRLSSCRPSRRHSHYYTPEAAGCPSVTASGQGCPTAAQLRPVPPPTSPILNSSSSSSSSAALQRPASGAGSFLSPSDSACSPYLAASSSSGCDSPSGGTSDPMSCSSPTASLLSGPLAAAMGSCSSPTSSLASSSALMSPCGGLMIPANFFPSVLVEDDRESSLSTNSSNYNGKSEHINSRHEKLEQLRNNADVLNNIHHHNLNINNNNSNHAAAHWPIYETIAEDACDSAATAKTSVKDPALKFIHGRRRGGKSKRYGGHVPLVGGCVGSPDEERLPGAAGGHDRCSVM